MASKSSLRPEDLVVVICLLVVGCVTYFVAMPQATTLKEQSVALAAKQAEAKVLNQRIADLTSLSDRLPRYTAAIDRLALAYPKEEQQIEAFIQAQTIVERSGMTVVNLAPGKAKDGKLPIAFSLTGSHEALNRLFQELNENLRPITIESWVITAGGEKSNGAISVSLNAHFHFNGTVAAAPAGAPVLPATQEDPLPTAQ